MVNVSWITPFAPDRSGGGGQIRQAHLLLALARRARVELICPGPVTDPEVRAAVARLVEVDAVASDWRQRHRWLRRVADLGAPVVSRQPMEVRAFRPVRRCLASAAGHIDADVVLVEYAGLAPLIREIGDRRREPAKSCPWVLTLHNLPSRMATQQAALMPHRRQRWLLARDATTAAEFEQWAATTFDAVITCTEVDAATLDKSAHVLVVPNGTDTARFQPTPLPSAARIVFTAALYTTPNIDGARWFCERVLPLIRLQEPSAAVDLVGSRPVAEVLALGDLAGVTVHADVPSVVPFLDEVRVAVVPIRVGSGSRLKALEALAAGRPVVGTTIGLEGLGLAPGENALVADAPEDFAAAVLTLLRDDELAARLAAAGRKVVEERFAWSTIAEAFADSVLALAEARHAQPGATTG